MRQIPLIAVGIFSALIILLPVPLNAHDGSSLGFMERHQAFMSSGVPAAYNGQRRPSDQSPDDLAAGGKLYKSECAVCHGDEGTGNGAMAKDLKPRPANLQWLVSKPHHGDDFFLWSMMEGGTPFGTAMPAFNDTLSKRQIWQIIGFMRSEFAGKAPKGKQKHKGMHHNMHKGPHYKMQKEMRK